MENVPNKIYLQIGDDCPNDVDFNELVGVSWCSDRINDNDIEFILVPRVGQPVPDTEANDNKHAVKSSFCDCENPKYGYTQPVCFHCRREVKVD